MTEVVIFAPSPLLTVTIEDNPDGPEVHLHAGGQGVWQARMLLRMGIDVAMCCVLSGETGRMLLHLLSDEGIRVVPVDRGARGGTFVHDRRGGDRVKIVETPGDPISRHDLDELYGLTIREGLGADILILSGPAGDDTLPHDVYRRLAADLSSNDCAVIVDLAGERLAAALAGGVRVAKVSDDELVESGRITSESTDQVIRAMRSMHEDGAQTVIVTRAERPLLMLDDHVLTEVTPPTMEVTDTAGAGDSLTAGVAASLARGEPMAEAIMLGAAAGALNVTRHGLGTGDPQAIDKLRERVKTRSVGEQGEGSASFSPDELAARLAESE